MALESVFNFLSNVAGGKAAEKTNLANIELDKFDEANRRAAEDRATRLNTGKRTDSTASLNTSGGIDVGFTGPSKRLQEIDLESANRTGDLLNNFDFNINQPEADSIVAREAALRQGEFDRRGADQAKQFTRAGAGTNTGIAGAQADAAALFALKNQLPGPREAKELGINLSNARIGNLQQAIAANQRLAPPDPGSPGPSAAQAPAQLPPLPGTVDLGASIIPSVLRDITGFQQGLASQDRRRKELEEAFRLIKEQGLV